MKVLFYRYGSICEPDIIDTFQEIGLEVDEYTKEITMKVTPRWQELLPQFLALKLKYQNLHTDYALMEKETTQDTLEKPTQLSFSKKKQTTNHIYGAPSRKPSLDAKVKNQEEALHSASA